MLRGAARVEFERLLERADRELATPEQLQHAHPRRMPEHTEEIRLSA